MGTGGTTQVLLTVSGVIPSTVTDDVTLGRRPRVDYLEMARAFGADLLDYSEARRASGRTGRLLRLVGGDNAVLAWVCYRRRRSYELIFTDGEQVGLPLAVLFWTARRRPRHYMIVHILSVPKKSVAFRLLRLHRNIDRFFVYATSQKRFIIDHLGVAEDAVILTPFMVDTDFFVPVPHQPSPRALICSAGLEFRDYPTLVEAVRDMDVDVVLAAASPWSKRPDSSTDVVLPENVVVRKLDFADLRSLYADADLVVIPLVETDFQAGITTILEAMSMGKPVVCTRTTGQTDTISDEQTGLEVPPADVASLQEAIERLLDNPEEAGRLGQAARTWAVEHADITRYVTDLAVHVRAGLAQSP